MAREATDKSKVSDSSPPSGVRLSSLGRSTMPPRPTMKSVPPAPLWPAPRRPLNTPAPPPSSPFAELLPGRVVQPIAGAPQPPSVLSPSKRKLTARFWPPAPGSVAPAITEEEGDDDVPARSAQPPAPPVETPPAVAAPLPTPAPATAATLRSFAVAATPSEASPPEASPLEPAFSEEAPGRRASLASLADVLRWTPPPLPPEALRRRRIAYGVMIAIAAAVLVEIGILVAG